MTRRKSNKEYPICMCNNISKEKVEAAISRGCKNVSQVADATSAGIGPCGGSCRPYIAYMLAHYQQTGTFPKDPRKK